MRQPLSQLGTGVWLMMVRAQLGKLYGKDAPECAAFASLPTTVSNDPNDLRQALAERVALLRRTITALSSAPTSALRAQGSRVFIGHGQSPVWRELKDFLVERMRLDFDEFNRQSTPGYATTERLEEMLSESSFAFLVMTGDDERDDGRYARPNVIHEVGLFQGKLGFRRAIVLLEVDCAEFSNIHGLTQIRFPRGNIAAAFEDIRRVLEREGLTQG